MKKYLMITFVLSVFVISSCKKDTCTISGDKIDCASEFDVSKCNASQLESFKEGCEQNNGKLSSK